MPAFIFHQKKFRNWVYANKELGNSRVYRALHFLRVAELRPDGETTNINANAKPSVNEVEVAGFLSQPITAIYQLLSVPAVVLSPACKWSGEIGTDIDSEIIMRLRFRFYGWFFPQLQMLVRPVRSAKPQ